MNKTGHRIYLDHAATTSVREEVVRAILPMFTEWSGNPSSIYEEGQEAATHLEQARTKFATAINASADDIYFTSCGTESDNWAIKGAAYAARNKGKHLITSAIEHHAVLHSMETLEKEGFSVTYLPVDAQGLVQLEELEKALRDDTVLVSIMMANNEVGTIQPIKEMAALCRSKKILFHSDAVQALGALPIDVQDLGVDMLSFSGHKLYAPKGVGALYVRRGVRLNNLLDGGAQERRKRGGTENTPYIVGFAEALKLATEEMPVQSQKLTEMRDYLIDRILTNIPYSRLNGDPKKRLPNNVNISFEFIEGEGILLLLDSMGYACSSGSACTSASLDPSHVLLAMGLPAEIAHGSLRISLGRENTMADCEALVSDLPRIVARLRELSPLWEEFQKGLIKKSLINGKAYAEQ